MDHLRGDSEHGLPAAVALRLRRLSHASFLKVTVDLAGDELCLRGVVSSYYAKQVASETCRAMAGEYRIRNELRVTYPEERRMVGDGFHTAGRTE